MQSRETGLGNYSVTTEINDDICFNGPQTASTRPLLLQPQGHFSRLEPTIQLTLAETQKKLLRWVGG